MRLRHFAAALAAAAIVLPTVAADAGEGTLFLRSEGAGCADKVNTLQLEAGEGETTCNTRVGAPLYEIDQQTGAGLDGMDTYSAKGDVLGFVLDATQPLAGTLTFRHGNTPSDQGAPPQAIPAGGGIYEVDIMVRVNGKTALSETITYQGGSMDLVEVPFELDIDDAFDGQLVEKLTFAVGVGGFTPNSGWIKLDGASFINVPRAA